MMTPILGVASALVMGWTRRAFFLLLVVVVAASLSSTFAWLLCFRADFPRGILLPGEVSACTDPGTEDLMIALAVGVAGAYVQINRTEASLLPGAAIGVSLIPPLSAAGTLVYFGEWHQGVDAALLFATNLRAIILAACVVYISAGATSVLRKGRRRKNFVLGVTVTAVFLGAIILQLGRATYYRYREGTHAGSPSKNSPAIASLIFPASVEAASPPCIPCQRVNDLPRRVAAVDVVPSLDPGEQISARLVIGGVDAMVDALGLQQPEEALHGRVVEAIAFTAHGWRDLRHLKGFSVVLAGVLDCGIHMADEPRRRSPSPHRHLERFHGDLGVQRLAIIFAALATASARSRTSA